MNIQNVITDKAKQQNKSNDNDDVTTMMIITWKSKLMEKLLKFNRKQQPLSLSSSNRNFIDYHGGMVEN